MVPFKGGAVMNLGQMRLAKFVVVIILGVLFIVVSKGNSAEAETHVVDINGNGDYEEIQDAVDAADGGDVIRVWDGTYEEHIVLDKAISLIGNNSQSTVVDGCGNSNAIQITANGVTLSGLKITNSGNMGTYTGIDVRSNYNRIYDCELFDGGRYGIYVSGSGWNNISHNVCTKNDYAIFLDDSSDSILQNNTCLNNLVGIRLQSSTNITITNNSCLSNIEYGMFLSKNSEMNTITSNTCSDSVYGIYLSNSGDNEVHYNRIFDNKLFGIYTTGPSTIDGQKNYWGSANGPGGEGLGSGDDISTNVNYKPWYATPTTIPSREFVEVKNNLVKGYSDTIQGGIDAASNGDMIGVGDGVYYENILVEKSISLLGNGPENTTINAGDNGDVVIIRSDYVAMSGFRLESNGGREDHEAGMLIESDYNLISGMICTGAYYGMCLKDSSFNILCNNTLSENTIGICLEDYSEHNIAHDNNIFENTKYGISALNNNACSMNATANWWGDPTGPYHAIKNTQGKGDNVTDYVEFEYEVQESFDERASAFIDSVTPNPALDTDTVHFEGHGVTPEAEIRRYVWRSSIDNEISNSTKPQCQRSGLSPGNHTIFLKVMDNNGIWTEETSIPLIIHRRPFATITSALGEVVLDTDTICFSGKGVDDGTINRYVWRSSLDGEMYNGTATSFNHPGFSPGIHTIFLKVMDNYNVWSEEVFINVIVTQQPVVIIDSISPNPASEDGNVLFRGRSTGGTTVVRYVWRSSIDGEVYNGTESSFLYSRLSPGNHTIYLRAQNSNDFWSEEVSEELVVNEKRRNGRGVISSRDISYLFIVLALFFGGNVAVLIYVSHGLNGLRPRMLQFFSSFYSRLTKEEIKKDILRQNNRGRIYQFIMATPGASFSTIKKNVHIGTGTVVHHLSILGKQGFIRSVTCGNHRRFWVKAAFPKDECAKLMKVQQMIVALLEENEMMSRSDILREIGVSKSTLHAHLKCLKKKGIIVEERQGKDHYCSLTYS